MKTVPFIVCECGKRGFEDEHDAEKALGRSQAKRRRAMEKAGTRRGHKQESRYYLCDYDDLFHLTSESQKEHREKQDGSLTWEAFLAQQAVAA